MLLGIKLNLKQSLHFIFLQPTPRGDLCVKSTMRPILLNDRMS